MNIQTDDNTHVSHSDEDIDIDTSFQNVPSHSHYDSNLDYVNIIDKLNERESSYFVEGDEEDHNELFAKNINCKYYNEEQFHNSTITTSGNQFSLIHFNARSLYKNFDSICEYLMSLDFSFSIIGITETWMFNRPEIFSLSGYKFVQSARLSGRGGGVAFFVHNMLNFRILENITFNIDGVESLFIETVSSTNKNIIIGVVYRKPSSNAADFVNEFENIMHTISRNHKTCYIMGDFNLNLLDFAKVSNVSNFLDMFFSFGFYPLFNKPTRISKDSATLLDNIFTNSTHENNLSGICISDISDHFPIFHISSLSECIDKVNAKCFVRNITSTSVTLLTNDLKVFDWNIVLHLDDVNIAYETFLNKFLFLCDRHMPIHPKENKHRTKIKKPWITRDILKSIKKNNVLYGLYKSDPSVHNKFNYTQHRNKLNSLKRCAKRKYYFDKIKAVKSDLRKTWNVVNSILSKKKCTAPQKLHHNGITVDKPSEIANVFNNHFVNVGESLLRSIPDSHSSYSDYLQGNFVQSLFFKPATESEVLNIVNKMPNGNSSGYDDINTHLLKSVIKFLLIPLTHICNLSLTNGVFPSNMKIAKIIPLFKKGDTDSVDNYRPISVLPSFSKILERLVFNRLSNFLTHFNVLSNDQYGFRKDCSTGLAVLDLYDKIIRYVDVNKHAICVFMDLSKAFDTIPHDILLAKLRFYGVRGLPHKWFCSYLADRKQYTSVNSHNSVYETILHGVPQGSILGPLLFLIYINDIVNCSSFCKFTLFADDTTILASNQDFDRLIDDLNINLKCVYEWLICNKLSLNISKTKFMIFKSARNSNPI